MIKIIVENLTVEGINYEGSEPADFLELSNEEPYTINGPVEYEFTASLAANDVLVRGSAATPIAGECGTCLTECTETITKNDICCYFEAPGQGELNITDEFREEISLDLPANITCSPSCKGLCHKCGQNLNIKQCACEPDSEDEDDEKNIWNKLDDLKFDKE